MGYFKIFEKSFGSPSFSYSVFKRKERNENRDT